MIFLTYKHKCIVDWMIYVTHRLRVETCRPRTRARTRARARDRDRGVAGQLYCSYWHRISTLRYGLRSLAVAGPSTWNSLAAPRYAAAVLHPRSVVIWKLNCLSERITSTLVDVSSCKSGRTELFRLIIIIVSRWTVSIAAPMTFSALLDVNLHTQHNLHTTRC